MLHSSVSKKDHTHLTYMYEEVKRGVVDRVGTLRKTELRVYSIRATELVRLPYNTLCKC